VETGSFLSGTERAERHKTDAEFFEHRQMLHLAGLEQLLDRARDVFDRYVGMNAVPVEQVDDAGAEPLERGLGDRLWPLMSNSKLVAMATSRRNGSSASPATDSLTKGP
jgi:hypothetical protein